MPKNTVVLESIYDLPDLTLQDQIPTEKRVRDISEYVAKSLATISIQTIVAEVKDAIYNEELNETMDTDCLTKRLIKEKIKIRYFK